MKTGSEEQQALLQRFVAACEANAHVAAAFLGGSFAAGMADEWSDLDIYAIVSDYGYDDFFAERRTFMQQLGHPVFLEDFNLFGFDMVLFTYADGVEGEFSLARESHFEHIHGGAFETLVDKKGLLAGRTFPLYNPGEEAQKRTLYALLYGFWDNLMHFIAGMRRGQLWTAYGSLDEMRMKCLKLARLKHDFTSEHSAYSKVETVVPREETRPLEATCCRLDREEMLGAAGILIGFYQEIAPALAATHGLNYMIDLERVSLERFGKLSKKEKQDGRN